MDEVGRRRSHCRRISWRVTVIHIYTSHVNARVVGEFLAAAAAAVSHAGHHLQISYDRLFVSLLASHLVSRHLNSANLISVKLGRAL